MKPFIGLKRIWYGNPIEAKPTGASLKTWMASAKEIKNVHQGTWGYTQDDPEITDYINELTGKPYFRDVTSNGTKTINFTLGEYDFETRKDLQGGSVTDGIWAAPVQVDPIYKAVLAQTKTGNYVLFPYAAIVAKVDTQDKNLGLGITAVAMDDTSHADVTEEYWVDGATATGLQSLEG